jgi:hypothetical protein
MEKLMNIQDRYYEHGFFITKISNDLKTLLWNEIYATEWVDDQIENLYKKIPNWYLTSHSHSIDSSGATRKTFEREIGKDVLSRVPASLLEIGNNVANSDELTFFKKYYNSNELMYVDLWNGAEEIAYHFDTINGADTLILIYLTEEQEWREDWGGQISLKKEVGSVIINEETIDPNNGTMLVINNANPLIQHKVKALVNENVNRYTFSFNYKWR